MKPASVDTESVKALSRQLKRMRTEVISARLPLHEAALVRRQAADKGLTKSEHAANLILHALDVEAHSKLPATLERLDDLLRDLAKGSKDAFAHNGAGQMGRGGALHSELRAFMIEVLVLLRYLTKNDLRLGGEIGRKLQRAVGDVRVEGT